jgi:hypothetical protein
MWFGVGSPLRAGAAAGSVALPSRTARRRSALSARHSGDTVGLPAIRITLRSTGGDAVASWVVEPSATAVEAGQTVGFRSALASPPADATQVTLNLTERKAQVIGLR